MLLMIIAQCLSRGSKVPEDFKRMLRAEYRSVPISYVERFLKENRRLPTMEELRNAV